jgi:hypothetical protein
VFTIDCPVRLSVRDSIEEAQVEAAYNFEQFHVTSEVHRDGVLVAGTDADGDFYHVVRGL